jgi:EmrB/QacA subfamily drug resistance transporter
MASTAPQQPPKLFDRALIGVSIVVVLGTFMSILDTTIVNVAINALGRDFNSSLATIQWVSTGYMLALATVIPLTGWAADRFGTKRLYMISIGLFLAGSALAGAAWSAESLIAFRVLQGLGGGMIMPAGMTILTRAAGPQRVGRVMSVVGVPMLMGPIVGPILGGWLVDDVSWRWIFYVNIPVGALALVAAARFLPRDTPQPAHRLDWLGLALLSPGLALFVYGLAQVATDGSVGATGALAPMLGGLALVGAFVAHALRSGWPLIDLRLFRNRTLSASAGTTWLLATAFFGAMVMIPLYYQLVRHQSALHAGLLLAPQGVGAALMMPLAGRAADRNGAGKVVLGGMVFMLAGMLGFTQVGNDTSYAELSGFQFLLGLGMGSTMMPAMSAAFQTMARADVARATTALNIIQRVGGSIGVALLSVVLSHQLGGGGELAQAAQSPGAADAFGTTFWWALALMVVAGFAATLLPRTKPAAQEQAPHAHAAEAATEAIAA